MCGLLTKLWGEQDAATSVEYSMVLALVAVAALVSWQGLGCGINKAVWYAAFRMQWATWTANR